MGSLHMSVVDLQEEQSIDINPVKVGVEAEFMIFDGFFLIFDLSNVVIYNWDMDCASLE